MNCSEVSYLAPMYLSRELDPEVLADLEQHLAECRECARELELQQHYDVVLRRAVLGQESDTKPVIEHLQQQIIGKPKRWQWFSRPLPAFASAAALILVMIGGTIVLLPRRQNIQSAPQPGVQARVNPTIYEDAADDHTDEIIRRAPRRWRSNPEEIRELVIKQVGDASVLTSLATDGLQLDRARVCGLLHKTYVHLVYKKGDQEVSYFVRRRDGEQLTGPAVTSAGDKVLHADTVGKLQVGGMQSPSLTILLVTGFSRAETMEVLTHVMSSISADLQVYRAALAS